MLLHIITTPFSSYSSLSSGPSCSASWCAAHWGENTEVLALLMSFRSKQKHRAAKTPARARAGARAQALCRRHSTLTLQLIQHLTFPFPQWFRTLIPDRRTCARTYGVTPHARSDGTTCTLRRLLPTTKVSIEFAFSSRAVQRSWDGCFAILFFFLLQRYNR